MNKSFFKTLRLSGATLFLVIIFSAVNVIARAIVNDVTQINPIVVDDVLSPTTVEEIQAAVKSHTGPISIGGGRYSMGGQTATEHALQIDMRTMNKVVNFDAANKKITVQTGMRWRDIQDVIDAQDLSIKIMQTYSNFTVGGSLSVNVHGRYIGEGPLVRSIDSIKVVLADGSIVEASPSQNSDIFYAAIGGYGGIGVIVEATLNLAVNEKVERVVKIVSAAEYTQYFKSEIRDNPKVVFQNGDIYPPEFETVNSVSWQRTDKPLTITDRLIPRGQKYVLQPKAISAMVAMPFGRKIRSSIVDPLLYSKEMVVHRNYEASYDVAELEPPSRKETTFVLQEYFVPVAKFNEFIPLMRDIFKKHDVEVFNVSIRHALPDPGTYLAWAPQEVYAFVVYYRQGTSPTAKEEVKLWTREMISAVLTVNGAYYLPYQIHATDDQFQRAYPKFQEYFDVKKKYDPTYKFRNKLWDHYFASIPAPIAKTIAALPGYQRREDQSYLALPEWYIVFNSDEYATFLKTHKPSAFPYWKSAKEFWNLKRIIEDTIVDKYPANTGYKVMLWVIGTSYSAELLIKGAYENTIGRLTEALSSPNGTPEDSEMQKIHQRYADFVHVYPWYDFSFIDCLKDFWRNSPMSGENMIRKWERKLFFSTELLFKAAYGKLIQLGTHMSYEPEADHIVAVVEDPQNALDSLQSVKVLERTGDFKLVSFPRYDSFRDLLLTLTKKGLKFTEIAGNRKIFLTAIGPAGSEKLVPPEIVIGTSQLATEPAKIRFMISTSVSSLMDGLALAKDNQITIEHIFDY